MSMIIKDPIHNFVKLPVLCQQVLDTPEFQRLRRIKQLGLAYYVFPAASHTRFEHSLGVMHLAGQVIDVIREESKIEISDREKQLVQLAGMLHDVGHVAFSHLFDDFLAELHGFDKKKSTLFEHEVRSVFIVREINKRKRILTFEEEKFIANCILGTVNESHPHPFLFEIVCNKQCGLDVDKFDYIQRDMHHIGLPGFNSQYIINRMRIQNGRLALLLKAESDIRTMYFARRRILMDICSHKIIKKIEQIIVQCISSTGCVKNFEKNWLQYTDYSLETKFYSECPKLMNKIDTRDVSDVYPRVCHLKHISEMEINEIIEHDIFWVKK